MKKLIFFILIIPLILSSWTGTWDKGYVVEEKVDTLRFTTIYTTASAQRIINSTSTYLEWQLNTPGHVLIAHHLFSKLFYDGAEKVYIDSLKVTFYHNVIDSSDTFYVRIDTLGSSNNSRWYPFKTLLIPEYTTNGLSEVSFYDLEIKQPEKFSIFWWMKAEGTATYLNPRWVIIYYKAYYKVR